MNITEARRAMFDLLTLYFAGATVAYANQSNAVKGNTPLVTLSTVSVNRPQNPPTAFVDGVPVSYHAMTLVLQVDLYTKGSPVEVGSGMTVPMENTALSDMMDFANFMCSEYVVNWSHQNDVSVALNGDVRDTTALINSTSYQFRATLELTMNFTQKAIGYTGILEPSSIKHSTPEGEAAGDDGADDVYVEPEFSPTHSGGGTADLAEEPIGYFTEAEIKEEN